MVIKGRMEGKDQRAKGKGRREEERRGTCFIRWGGVERGRGGCFFIRGGEGRGKVVDSKDMGGVEAIGVIRMGK